MPNHKYQSFKIKKEHTNRFAERYAQQYIELRSAHTVDEGQLIQSGLLGDLDFDTSGLKNLFEKYTIPDRQKAEPGKKGTYRDIFRSDLGELVLTNYFEWGVEQVNFQTGKEKAFTIPLKNIYDRETNHLPGRGLDLVGYRIEPKLTLLLGEAKVSHQKRNPPQVVDYPNKSNDSIYHSQKKNHDDHKYLLRRLSNYAKKLTENDLTAMTAILLHLEQGNLDGFHTVYGCCLVRDEICSKLPEDYGKLKSDNSDFEPGEVHFMIPVFELPIHEVVDIFEAEVNRKLTGNG